MKITFLQDHQSVLSGNEFYSAGARADLPAGAALIAQGVARETWAGRPPKPVEPEPMEVEQPEVEVVEVEPVEADDLTAIKGVGAKTALALNDAGITTYTALIAADPAVLNDKLDGILNFITIEKIQAWQEIARGL